MKPEIAIGLHAAVGYLRSVQGAFSEYSGVLADNLELMSLETDMDRPFDWAPEHEYRDVSVYNLYGFLEAPAKDVPESMKDAYRQTITWLKDEPEPAFETFVRVI